MRNLMYVGIALVVIGIAVGIYYLIPGFHHIIGFTFSKAGTAAATDSRPLHAVGAFVVAIVGAVLVFLSRRSKKATAAA